MERNDGALQVLMSWLTSEGLKLSPKIRIEHFSHDKGYGIVAAANIEDGEELFTLPEALTDLKSRKSTGANTAIDALLTTSELDKHNCLVLRLMHEYDSVRSCEYSCVTWAHPEENTVFSCSSISDKPRRYLQGSASKWATYFQFLQNIAITTPYFWPQKELASLEGTSVLQRMEEDIDIREFFEKTISPIIMKYLSAGVAARYTFELFRRLNHIVMSRAFSLNDGDAAFIFPFADFFNAKTKGYDARLGEHNGRMFMYAVQPIASGSEIFVTYGELPNARLLLRYGFVEENNDFDYVQVEPEAVVAVLAGAEEDEMTEANDSLSGYLDEHGPESFVLQKGGELPAELYTVLKIILLPPEDSAKFFERSPPFEQAEALLIELLSDFPAVETAKEIDKLALLVLASRLSLYNSTLEEDEAIWFSNAYVITDFFSELPKTRDFYQRCGLVVRIGEKRILTEAMARIKAKYAKKEEAPTPKKPRKDEKSKKPAAANRPKMIG